MLKIIPTTSVNNEEFLKKEMNIHTSLADFISEAENADKLISTISLLFKDEKKNEKAIYDKLLFIFSLVLNGKNVEYAEKMKKSIENVISAAKSLKVVDENKILSDLYFMFPEGQFETKELLLEKIVAVEGKNYEQVVDIFYNAFKINKKSISSICNCCNHISKTAYGFKWYWIFDVSQPNKSNVITNEDLYLLTS